MPLVGYVGGNDMGDEKGGSLAAGLRDGCPGRRSSFDRKETFCSFLIKGDL
jgi:hypothetical protein